MQKGSIDQIADFLTGPVTDARHIPCFTPGTGIATPRGEVPVEALQADDRLITRDNGIQRIVWIGKKRLDHEQLNEMPQLRPILIRKGALGDGMPEADLLVSPSHRMLVTSELAEEQFKREEVLIAARDLLAMDGVEVSKTPYITYLHFLCAAHEVVLAQGAWTESFQPNDVTLKGFDAAQREEIFSIFPELNTKEGMRKYTAARKTLSRRQSKLIFTD